MGRARSTRPRYTQREACLGLMLPVCSGPGKLLNSVQILSTSKGLRKTIVMVFAAPHHGSESDHCRAERRVTCIHHLIHSTPLNRERGLGRAPSSSSLRESLSSSTSWAGSQARTPASSHIHCLPDQHCRETLITSWKKVIKNQCWVPSNLLYFHQNIY